MKLISKYIEKDRSGRVTVCPEEPEDMWHIYNLIMPGDRLKATAFRRVQSVTATGSTSSQRVRTTLTIKVERTEFDAQECVLSVNGQNVVENEYVKLGQYHTLDLELNRNFTIYKVEWDTIAFERIAEACDVTNRADLAAVVLQEGLANICLVTPSMTIVRQRVETSVPRKRKGFAANHEQGLRKFYEHVMQAIINHIKFDVVKAVLVASPGFVKDNLFQYIMEEAEKRELKELLANKNKFVLVHCSSGHKHALEEIMRQPAMQARLADTKAAAEVRAMERFYEMLGKDDGRAFYGWDHVRKANARGAIETLLVTDGLFRSVDLVQRRRYVRLVESVRQNGGKVLIFSTQHVTGEQLQQLTGVAAILHYPVPDIEDDEEDEQPAADSGSGQRV
ncbi:eRF1 domain 1-domain-containing protein [Thamnocephalis sphaerospora]|uniref:Protein DOM34 homolog n=1 Tax=Thamnocephalis sphaerospora TaxID=78915 RepID=A0A4P9XSY7_9FUNG|nr:eRF1 domain 1-domain-containing protein [Thamnocephalis sphaerospora]|eukprot:RKP08631.1 eRF1 domain 1-domain-containing protein [Thamnocephalis sphaerospora]